MNTLFLSAMPGATLVPDTFSHHAAPAVSGQYELLGSSAGALSGHAVVLSPAQIVVAPESTTVLPRDLFEPNDTTPSGST